MAKEREVNTVNYSPLRYPGGKSRLAPFISNHKVIFDYLFKSSYMPV